MPVVPRVPGESLRALERLAVGVDELEGDVEGEEELELVDGLRGGGGEGRGRGGDGGRDAAAVVGRGSGRRGGCCCTKVVIFSFTFLNETTLNPPSDLTDSAIDALDGVCTFSSSSPSS